MSNYFKKPAKRLFDATVKAQTEGKDITFISKRNMRVSGHWPDPKPQPGDRILFTMSPSLRVGVFVVVDSEIRPDIEPDLFFAILEEVGYEDKLDHNGFRPWTPQ